MTGVVVLTDALYIFVLVLSWRLACLAGYEGEVVYVEVIQHVFESF